MNNFDIEQVGIHILRKKPVMLKLHNQRICALLFDVENEINTSNILLRYFDFNKKCSVKSDISNIESIYTLEKHSINKEVIDFKRNISECSLIFG